VLDDDASKFGTSIAGVPVNGPLLDEVARHAAGGLRHAILAMPGLPPERLSTLLDALDACEGRYGLVVAHGAQGVGSAMIVERMA
jgi:FlaA1/EpsC-like NDP-sugar epimerase